MSRAPHSPTDRREWRRRHDARSFEPPERDSSAGIPGIASIVRQLLRQIRSRSETAIVYERTQEFTPEFYNPARGDRLLNPLGQRMPHWTPGDEVTHSAEALSLATSLGPAAPTESAPIIIESARRILAHPLKII